MISIRKKKNPILERLVFKHVEKDFYLVADAYDGQYIRQTTTDFLQSCAGLLNYTLHIEQNIIGINGCEVLPYYIRHDGLMDLRLTDTFKCAGGAKRNRIILACFSKKYFAPFVKEANVYPLIRTNGLMCPEAYTLHASITGFINIEPDEAIKEGAATAYDKYQKSGKAFARALLVTVCGRNKHPIKSHVAIPCIKSIKLIFRYSYYMI